MNELPARHTIQEFFMKRFFLGRLACCGLVFTCSTSFLSILSALELPKTVAHRGFSAIAPENTCASIRKAWEAGAGGSECDVCVTRDNVVCLMHDDSTKRTSNGKTDVKMAEAAWDQLKEIRVPANTFGYEDEKIPTLVQALEIHKQCPGCYPVIEVNDARAALGVLEDLKKTDMLDKAFVISFSGDAVKTIRANSKVPTAYLFGKLATPEDVRNAARRTIEAGADMIDIMYHPGLTAEHIKAGHDEGVRVWVWTVNDLTIMKKLLAMGVDSVTTDRPDLMAIALAGDSEMCEWIGTDGDFENEKNFTPKKSSQIVMGTADHPNAKAVIDAEKTVLETLVLANAPGTKAELEICSPKTTLSAVSFGTAGEADVTLAKDASATASSIFIAQEPGSKGCLTLRGNLETISFALGNAKETFGKLTIDGGQLKVMGPVNFGDAGDSVIEMNGGELLAGGNVLFGETNLGATEFTLNDGLFHTRLGLTLGSHGEAYLNIHGGELRADGQFVVGFYSGNSIVRQTGGIANIRGTNSAWGVRTNPGFIENYSADDMNSCCAGVQFAGTRHGSNEFRGGETGEYFLSGGTLNTPRIFSMTAGRKPLFHLSGDGIANVLSDPEIPYSGIVSAPMEMTGGTLRTETILARGFMVNDTFLQQGGTLEPVGNAKLDGNFEMKDSRVLFRVDSKEKFTSLAVTGNFTAENAVFAVELSDAAKKAVESGAVLEIRLFPDACPAGNFKIISDSACVGTERLEKEGILILRKR